LNFFFYLLRLRRFKAKCVKARYLQEGVGQFEPRFQGEGSSSANILIPLDRQLIALQLCRWQLLYNETMQLIPILRKLGAA